MLDFINKEIVVTLIIVMIKCSKIHRLVYPVRQPTNAKHTKDLCIVVMKHTGLTFAAQQHSQSL